MKTNIQVFLLLVVIAVLVPVRTFAAIRITEIAWMGVSGANGQYGEWFELYNDGTDSVPLAGWKLYGDGGGKLLYTLTSTIPAAGYLLVERTTGSMTDPVPGIDDEHGTFGGGGLSNSGENLVLKDSAGAIVESLPFASGWPAGDATTKQTMQWNGSAWITADPTPKAATQTTTPTTDTDQPTTPSNDGTTDTTKNNVDAPKITVHSVAKKKPVRQTPHIDLTMPNRLIVHTPYKFNPTVYTETDTNPLDGTYRWNFGDGSTVSSFNGVKPAQHTYLYPGTYTLWFEYYATEFDEDPVLFLKTDLVVTDPELSTEVVDNGSAVQITNNSATAVDLSHWLVMSNGFQAILPKMTTLSSHATIVIPAAALRIPLAASVALLAPDGTPIR